jgi:hypothetical protein
VPADLIMHQESPFKKLKEKITFNATSSLRAIVTDRASGDPISGASIRVAGDSVETSGRSNARGEVLIRDIPIGVHSVIVSAEGYRFATEEAFEFPPSEDISKPSVKTTRIRLEPEEEKVALATMKATVFDKSTGQLLSGAEVKLTSQTHSARGTSNGAGQVVIENLPYGKYTLTASRPQYKSLSPQNLTLAKAVSSGKIRLTPEEKEVIPPKPPPPPPTPPTPPPKPPEPPSVKPGPCNYEEIGSFDGASSQEVIHQKISSDEHVFSGPGHQVSVPGPGTLRVTVRTTGKHEMANHEYGALRFASKIVLSSPQGAVKDGSWVGGGSFYPGVRDYGTNSYSWEVKNAGDIHFRYVPERCHLQKSKGEPHCYNYGTEIPGIKLLNTSYEMKVEFKPCK